MKNLDKKDYKLFKSIVSAKTEVLFLSLKNYLKSRYDEVYVGAKEDYMMAVGDLPVALVAHLDTIFSQPPDEDYIFYDKEANVIWSPEGGCGDDRLGVFGILKLIHKGYRPTVIFTTGEEAGGIGASSLILDFPQAPENLKYIIELDRQGIDDCVFYRCNNFDFIKHIESFGFKKDWGSFSDISIICPTWGIAGVNLSIGYLNEHSYSETVWISAFDKTIKRVSKILDSCLEHEKYEFIPYIPPSFEYKGKYRCCCCDKEKGLEDTMPLIVSKEKIRYICYDCCNEQENLDKIQWCYICGEAYLSDTDNQLCPICEERVVV